MRRLLLLLRGYCLALTGLVLRGRSAQVGRREGGRAGGAGEVRVRSGERVGEEQRAGVEWEGGGYQRGGWRRRLGRSVACTSCRPVPRFRTSRTARACGPARPGRVPRPGRGRWERGRRRR